MSTNPCLSFLVALTPTPAIFQSKFYRRSVPFAPRTFHTPSCAFHLLLSRLHGVIIHDRLSHMVRMVERSWPRGFVTGRGSMMWERTHPVRIWHCQPPSLVSSYFSNSGGIPFRYPVGARGFNALSSKILTIVVTNVIPPSCLSLP
jgi:hypothetical protein